MVGALVKPRGTAWVVFNVMGITTVLDLVLFELYEVIVKLSIMEPQKKLK